MHPSEFGDDIQHWTVPINRQPADFTLCCT